MLRRFIIALLFISANLAFAGSNHCPLNANFGGVEIQPLPDHAGSLVQCLSTNGNTYWSKVADAAVDVTDKLWIHQKYPKAQVCFGTEPEECTFYTG